MVGVRYARRSAIRSQAQPWRLEVIAHERGDKVIAFKKRRRQNSRRKRGYRGQ